MIQIFSHNGEAILPLATRRVLDANHPSFASDPNIRFGSHGRRKNELNLNGSFDRWTGSRHNKCAQHADIARAPFPPQTPVMRALPEKQGRGTQSIP
jgi:hypothetical protein